MRLPFFSNTSFNWLIAEMTVVVLGILVAFQIEEWRSDNNEREIEIALLENMISDIEGEQFNFRNYRDLIKESTESGAELFSYLKSGNPRSADEIRRLWISTVNEWRWRKTSPTYTGWRESGRPDLISNESLRARLFGFHEQYLEYLDEETKRYQQARLDFVSASRNDLEIHPEFNEELDSFSRNLSVVHPLSELPRNPEFFPKLNQLMSRTVTVHQELERSLDTSEQIRLEILAHLETL